MTGSGRGEKGFTLLELVVAIAIFALMAAFAYGGLGSVLNLSASTTQQSERLGEVQRAVAVLERDLESAIVRNPMGEFSPEGERPFSSGDGWLFQLTHKGVPNPLGLARSDLQRVAWSYTGGDLVRVTWPQLDVPLGAEQPPSQRVLSGVSEVEASFLDAQGQWLTQWPAEQGGPAVASLPRAVQVRITLSDWGLVRRVVLLPDGPVDESQFPLSPG